MYAQIDSSLERLEFKFARDTDSTGSIYDLGEPLSENWKLSFDYRITIQGTGYADQYYIGLSDQNNIEYSYGGDTGDHLLWVVDNTGIMLELNDMAYHLRTILILDLPGQIVGLDIQVHLLLVTGIMSQ